MVDPVNPKHPPTSSEQTPAASQDAKKKGPPPAYGETSGKPMTFLGMKFTGPEAEKLWSAIMQQINTQIQQEQQQMLKALKKLRDDNSDEDS